MDYNLSKRTSVYALYADGDSIVLGGSGCSSDQIGSGAANGDVNAFSVGRDPLLLIQCRDNPVLSCMVEAGSFGSPFFMWISSPQDPENRVDAWLEMVLLLYLRHHLQVKENCSDSLRFSRVAKRLPAFAAA